MANNHTLISKGTQVVGEIYFHGELHVQGKVVGTILAEGSAELEVSQGGTVEGQIRAPKIVVRGTVNGDIHCFQHVELAATAVVNGNVFYNAIEMVKGSQVTGGLVYVNEQEHKKQAAVEVQSAGNS